MKTKTVLVMFVFVAVLLAACGGETVNTAGNSSQNGNAAAVEGAGDGSQPVDATATTKPAEDGAPGVSFANDVLPILESRCLTCHGGERTEGGLTLSSYASLMAGGKDGVVILPGDAAGSLLYQLVADGEMPKRGAKLTPVQLETLLEWINAGALDN